jgi:hypothetical protein
MGFVSVADSTKPRARAVVPRARARSNSCVVLSLGKSLRCARTTILTTRFVDIRTPESMIKLSRTRSATWT